MASIPSSQQRMKSRLSSLLHPSAGHWTEFSVELDDPVRIYRPGDTVKGTVVLNVARPLGVTHIVVRLHGHVQVFRSPSKKRKLYRPDATLARSLQGSRWTNEYYGDGYASLFEDEIVLCGSGRLDPKLFHFRFDLKFPKKGVPSSMEFEKGMVEYNISSTITRPAAISPTATCDRTIYYHDEIDIAPYQEPKQFLAHLEPINAHTSRAKSYGKKVVSHGKARRRSGLSRTNTDQSGVSHANTASNGNAASQADDQSQPLPSPTNTSFNSRPSSRINETEVQSSQTNGSTRGSSNGMAMHRRNEMIYGTVQLSKGAYLPGDNIPVSISIKHLKPIQRSAGIVATIYRQAGVDQHPNLPIAPADNSKAKKEDYYPKSRTGLGGLSLSAAGSSSVFRMDLSQTIQPFYVDPETLTAEINFSVPIPDDAFPTVRTVPGDMISFEYYVEVIVDIHGKLGPFSAPSAAAQPTSGTGKLASDRSGSRQNLVMLGQSCFNTQAIRRDKLALCFMCDFVLGTHDTVKVQNGKQRAVPSPVAPSRRRLLSSSANHAQARATSSRSTTSSQSASASRARSDGSTAAPAPYMYPQEYYDEWQHSGYDGSDPYGYGYYYYPYYYPYPYPPHPHYHPYGPGYAAEPGSQPGPATSPHMPGPAVPPPNMPNDANLSEKERLRRAEERLLPSQPPTALGVPYSAIDFEPSAPFIPGESDAPLPGTYAESSTRAPSQTVPLPQPATIPLGVEVVTQQFQALATAGSETSSPTVNGDSANGITAQAAAASHHSSSTTALSSAATQPASTTSHHYTASPDAQRLEVLQETALASEHLQTTRDDEITPVATLTDEPLPRYES